MGEPEHLDVHDLWIWGTPWEPLIVDLNIPNSLLHTKKTHIRFKRNVTLPNSNFGISFFELGNLGILESWNFETVTLWNFEILKHIHIAT